MEITKLSLAQKDKYLEKIDNEINTRRNLILEKMKKIEKKKRVNHFLEEVKEDYHKYYQYIIQEKQQQYDSLLLLKEYMNDLIKTENLVDEQLRTARYDQKDIIGEIDKVKAELDEFIQ